MYLHWQGLPVIPSRRAMQEMWREGLLIQDIVEVLEDGYECARSKRKKDIVEKCLDRKK